MSPKASGFAGGGGFGGGRGRPGPDVAPEPGVAPPDRGMKGRADDPDVRPHPPGQEARPAHAGFGKGAARPVDRQVDDTSEGSHDVSDGDVPSGDAASGDGEVASGDDAADGQIGAAVDDAMDSPPDDGQSDGHASDDVRTIDDTADAVTEFLDDVVGPAL